MLNIAKVFDKLIDIELSKLRIDSPNRQQVAYQKCLSSINTTFNLQEVKIHHIEKNSTIIIILLDCTNAFDPVPHDGSRIGSKF
jgi:hypothetical protein